MTTDGAPTSPARRSAASWRCRCRETVRANLLAAAGELARALPQKDLKWSRKVENLHVTIKFLGPVEETKLAAASAARWPRRWQTLPPFGIEVRGMGAFPSARKANVLWAGVDDVTAVWGWWRRRSRTIGGAAGDRRALERGRSART